MCGSIEPNMMGGATFFLFVGDSVMFQLYASFALLLGADFPIRPYGINKGDGSQFVCELQIVRVEL